MTVMPFEFLQHLYIVKN